MNGYDPKDHECAVGCEADTPGVDGVEEDYLDTDAVMEEVLGETSSTARISTAEATGFK